MKNLLRVNKKILTKSLNRIQSFLYWKGSDKSYPNGTVFPESYEYSLCPICEGDGIIKNEYGGAYFCLCNTIRWCNSLDKILQPFRSYHRQVFIEELDTSRHKKVGDAVSKAIEWCELPSGFFVISGGYGTGKSHTLQSIDGFFNPICLYITLADIEKFVFKGIGDKNLDKYIEVIRSAPILLLDDLGSEYGSEIVVAQVNNIIDFRYRDPERFPTAVATNFSGNELGSKERYGSRIMDRSNLLYASLNEVTDYRTRK